MTTLRGQTAIVTGGGSGIGAGIAIALAAEGANVVVCGRRADALERTVATVRSAGGNAVAISADVSQENDVDALVQATLDQFGTVDILVNNAAVFGAGHIHTHDVEAWDRVLAVNLRGPFLLARAVLPLMRAQGHGRIINISSEAAFNHYPGNGAYGVAKHALNALGEYMQRENQEQGIQVNTICPGMVITEMTERTPGLQHEKCLTPEDIADLVLWLVTRRANLKIGAPVLIQTMENPWK